MPSSDNTSSGPAYYNWKLGSHIMGEGLHNITITSLSSDFYLDYILINATKAYVPPPTLLADVESGTLSATASVSSAQYSSVGNHGKKDASTGVIAGGAVGGLAILGVLVTAFIFWYRSKRRYVMISSE